MEHTAERKLGERWTTEGVPGRAVWELPKQVLSCFVPGEPGQVEMRSFSWEGRGNIAATVGRPWPVPGE